MADEQQQSEQQAQANGQPTGADPGEKTESGKTFTQAELDAIVKERIERERRKADEATKKAAQDAEAKVLTEQGKYKELYEAIVAERDEYKPYRERYEALATQQRAALMAETAKWPAEVKALLPGDDADVQVLADAVAKARALVAALNGKTVEQAQGAHGLPPRAVGQDGKERETARREMAATVRNW